MICKKSKSVRCDYIYGNHNDFSVDHILKRIAARSLQETTKQFDRTLKITRYCADDVDYIEDLLRHDSEKSKLGCIWSEIKKLNAGLVNKYKIHKQCNRQFDVTYSGFPGRENDKYAEPLWRSSYDSLVEAYKKNMEQKNEERATLSKEERRKLIKSHPLEEGLFTFSKEIIEESYEHSESSFEWVGNLFNL